MTNAEDRLIIAKEQLSVALGEDTMKIYLSNLKLWFRKAWSKEQFDVECRRLLSSDQQQLHNEFFLAILSKITFPLPSDSTSKNSMGKKRKRRAGGERAVFEPYDLYDYLPEENDELRTPNTPLQQPRFAADELFLPDTSLILGRLLVVAWENGLANVDEDICKMLVSAVQNLLKNILMAIIKSRKQYRTTNCGRFDYDIGCPYKRPYIQNSATRQIIDDHPFEVDREVSSTSLLHRTDDESYFLAACEDNQQTSTNSQITMLDLYNALQDKNLIPCHSVYANNIERISQMLH